MLHSKKIMIVYPMEFRRTGNAKGRHLGRQVHPVEIFGDAPPRLEPDTMTRQRFGPSRSVAAQGIINLLLVSLFLIGTEMTCSAQSLFERSQFSQFDLVTNNVAIARGDILVVLINESTNLQNLDETSLERQGTSSLNGALNYGLTGNLGSQLGTSNFGQSSNSERTFEGDSEFRSDRRFRDRFAVTVVDVLPNGNLLVEGRRRIFLQGDTRTLQLSGSVRQIDILPDNIINSQMVANLEIRLLGDGPEQEFRTQGWLGRRLNRLLPF